jgi:glycerophosphoryl diester phosphodiesterase
MPRVIAHRGASKLQRENTLEAFRTAAAVGSDGVELDVRRSADDQLVVHHDSHLADGRLIRATNRDELPEYVPTLAEALDACVNVAIVNVEIKNDPEEEDFDPTDWLAGVTVAHLLHRRDNERWLISSFRRETIDRCRALAPEIRTAWLCVEPPAGSASRLAKAGHAAIHPYYLFVTQEFVAECHAEGLAVNVWTCDDPDAMRNLRTWGVDGICTNVPDIAIEVLAAEC